MPGGRQTHKQEKALAALLTAPTIEAAAAQAGVACRTLKRWLAAPPFRRAYQQARAAVVERVAAQLLQASTQAVTTLQELLTSDHRPTRCRAAVAILGKAVEAVQVLDLAEQVEALRQRLEDVQHVHHQLLDQTTRAARNGTR